MPAAGAEEEGPREHRVCRTGSDGSGGGGWGGSQFRKVRSLYKALPLVNYLPNKCGISVVFLRILALTTNRYVTHNKVLI